MHNLAGRSASQLAYLNISSVQELRFLQDILLRVWLIVFGFMLLTMMDVLLFF